MTPWDDFDACYIALLAALWAEMEAILQECHGADAAGEAGGQRTAGRTEAFLLELALLTDVAESLRRRGILSFAQADLLQALLAELGETLNFDPLDVTLPMARAAIGQAQNRVFDEVRQRGLGFDQADRKRAG